MEETKLTKVFSSSERFRAWAQERSTELAMDVERVSLSSLAPTWVVTEERLARPDGQFFSVEGVRVVRSAGREVSGWSQPMMFQPPGHVGLIQWLGNANTLTRDLLVRVMAEPGNRGIEISGVNTRVLVGPPVQFSPGNLAQHGRAIRGELDSDGRPYKRVPFADLASYSIPNWVTSAWWEDAVEDGGRFFEKKNRYGLISVKTREAVEDEIQATGQPENFVWISIGFLHDLRVMGYLNGHLRSLMSMLL